MVLRITEAFRERLLYGGASMQLGYQAPVSADPTVRALCQAMRTDVERGAPTGPLFAESLSMALLSYAVERLPSQRSPMRVKGLLSAAQQQRLRRHIEERLHENVSVGDLAALCGLQARHFSTLFRRAFGKTPYRYVIERRLARGAEQLGKTSADIGELALRLGFCSSSHFAVEFRRFYGVTPRGYARGEREGTSEAS
jgi:AraC family transcriptional regulator